MGPVVRTVMPNRPSCTEPNQHDAGHTRHDANGVYIVREDHVPEQLAFQKFEEIRETARRQIAARPS